jgi:hypothetical protein
MVLMAPTVLTDGPGGIGDTEGTKIDEPLLVSRVLRGKLISMEFLNPPDLHKFLSCPTQPCAKCGLYPAPLSQYHAEY